MPRGHRAWQGVDLVVVVVAVVVVVVFRCHCILINILLGLQAKQKWQKNGHERNIFVCVNFELLHVSMVNQFVLVSVCVSMCVCVHVLMCYRSIM